MATHIPLEEAQARLAEVTDGNFDVAYGEVLRVAGRLQDPCFDPFLVKLIGADDPLARAVAEVRRRNPGRTPARLHGKRVGGTTIEDIYIYPAPTPTGPLTAVSFGRGRALGRRP